MRSIVRSFQALIRNKRLSLAIFALVSIAVVFWSLSRVPALSEKAQMGVRTNITSIAFDVIAPVTANDGLVVRIAKTTANWLFTNWKGMTFGLLFSAAALTLLGTVRRRSFERAWLNTLSRMFFGAPLGVCVNCATPIAQGLYSAGARLETALATLISSPTLNVIVLSMSFTLLPWEIAFASVAGVFAILISLPWIIRIFAKDAAIANSNRPNNMLPPAPTPIMELETWGDAAAAGAKDFLKNLFFVVRVALPLMLLAGALGAAVIEVTPLKGLTELSASITTILMVSLVAVFLPVPMAFNVIVVMVLLNAGMNPGLAAVLLFGLSVFSIYPAAVLARQISARLSLALTTCMVIVAAVLGIATDTYFQHSEHQKRENLRAANQEISTNIVGQVVQICSSLPQHLVARCYSQQMPAMMDVVEGVDLCSDLPLAIDESGCRQALRLTRIRIAALERGSTEPCMRLGSQQSRRSCLRVVAPEVAMKDRDMEVCNQLSQPSDIQSCRNAYLNASLLFNPDDSACMHLEGDAKTLCGLNAQIYRIADAENLALCDDLGGDAGVVQQCRWVTATSLVGKRNDTSGCEMLSDEPRSRCLEHAFAWKAQRTQDFQPCQMIESKDLRDTCQVRAASAKVKFILATQTRAASIPKEPEQAKSEQHTTDSIDVKVMDVVDVYKDDSINIKGFPYNSSEEEKTFRKKNIDELGISSSWNFAATDLFEPFIMGKGVSSGDFNNDEWPDILLATESGVRLYKNMGGFFREFNIEQGDLDEKNVFLVTLVDVDGNGYQDIFATTYGGSNYLVSNSDGDFSEAEVKEFSGDGRLLTLSAGFGDLDQDGDLDLALGNWSSGSEKLFSPEFSANEILYQENGDYRRTVMDDIKGETNSVLITDLNGDQLADVLFGNDRLTPDFYYLGVGQGQFELIQRDDGVPLSSMFTMSLESADFNNDLAMDVFSTDMSFARAATVDYCDQVSTENCQHWLEILENLPDLGVSVCKGSFNAPACVDAMSISAAQLLKDDRPCNAITSSQSAQRLCRHLARTAAPEVAIDVNAHIEQRQQNTLLLKSGDSFFDAANELGVDSSYWSWNASAADLDKDGWNDIYVGNGFHFGDGFYEVQPNRMFRNVSGAEFDDVAGSWGLDDLINTPSYTYIDYDLDGDLDIFASGVMESPRLFENKLNSHNSVSFRLRQSGKNSDAIGATVTINSGDKAQIKELSLSGGFMSYDHPVVYFGLAESKVVDKLTIVWPDGEQTTITDPLEANHHYVVQRR